MRDLGKLIEAGDRLNKRQVETDRHEREKVAREPVYDDDFWREVGRRRAAGGLWKEIAPAVNYKYPHTSLCKVYNTLRREGKLPS